MAILVLIAGYGVEPKTAGENERSLCGYTSDEHSGRHLAYDYHTGSYQIIREVFFVTLKSLYTMAEVDARDSVV